MLKTIKIIFNDGTYSIQKYIVEYVSGKKFLFAAQQGEDGESMDMLCFYRKDIESVERKTTKGHFTPVQLKKQ